MFVSHSLVYCSVLTVLTVDTSIIPGNPGCHVVGASKTAVLISYCTLVAEEASEFTFSLFHILFLSLHSCRGHDPYQRDRTQ